MGGKDRDESAIARVKGVLAIYAQLGAIPKPSNLRGVGQIESVIESGWCAISVLRLDRLSR